MNTVNLILGLLSAVSIGLCVFILARIKHVVYLLEQPVVKKISPEMKLKTVKVDDGEEARRHNHRSPQGQNAGNNAGRSPQGQRNEGPRPEGQRDRNHRPEGQQGQQSPRPERGGNDHRGHDRNRDRDRDRGPRQERGERTDRGERGERGERPERQRPRLDVYSNDRDAAPAPAAVDAVPQHESAPVHAERPALAPRRPLAATVDREETAAPVASQPDLPPDAIFVGDDGDVQHGRRTQLKKKPRFNVEEEEAKSEENKVQA